MSRRSNEPTRQEFTRACTSSSVRPGTPPTLRRGRTGVSGLAASGFRESEDGPIREGMPKPEPGPGRMKAFRPLTGGSAGPAGPLLALPCMLGAAFLADAATGGRSLPFFLLLFVILSAVLSIGVWLLLRLAERAIRRLRGRPNG